MLDATRLQLAMFALCERVHWCVMFVVVLL